MWFPLKGMEIGADKHHKLQKYYQYKQNGECTKKFINWIYIQRSFHWHILYLSLFIYYLRPFINILNSPNMCDFYTSDKMISKSFFQSKQNPVPPSWNSMRLPFRKSYMNESRRGHLNADNSILGMLFQPSQRKHCS